MPIKGISDIRRFSRAGKIRLGFKDQSQSGREFPRKSDFFIFDPDDASMLPRIREIFGERPRSLNICFASEDVDRVFAQNYDLYTMNGLLCRGDGVTAQRVSENRSLFEVECVGPEDCPFSRQHGVGGRPGCRRHAKLEFFLPDYDALQVWQIDTTSFHSIVNVNSGLELLRSIAGRISFIEVTLVLRAQEAIAPDTGKKVNIYVLDLVLPVGLRNAAQLRPIVGDMPRVLLPNQSEDTPDDLYPASQISQPEPVQPEPVQPVSLAEDAEVQEALRPLQANIAAALLKSADEQKWDKETLLRLIRGKTKSRSKQESEALF